MQIQGTYKLFIFNIIDGDSSVFVADIDSFFGGLDDSNVDITLVFVEILERFACLECDDGNILIDACDYDFS